jgi:ribose transport system substrate-binding protein
MRLKQIVPLGLAIVALTGAATEGATAKPSSGPTVAFIAAVSNNPYFDYMICGAKAAITKAGGTLLAQAPSKFDPVQQTQILNALAARKPNAIAVDAIDVAAMTPPIKAVIKQGIPVLTWEEQMYVPGQITNVANNQFVMGQMAADLIAKKLHGQGKVWIMGFQPGVSSTDLRREGFLAEIKKYPGIKYIGEQYAGTDSTKAAQQTSAVLLTNPDLAAVWGEDAYGIQGVINAVDQAGKKGKIVIVSPDMLQNEVDWIKSGEAYALIGQQPYKEGYQAAETILSALKGKKFPKQVFVKNPFLVVTSANVNTTTVKNAIPKSTCTSS